MAKTNCAVDIPVISSAFITKDGVEILSSMKAPRYVDYINVLFGRVFAEEYRNNDSFVSLSDFTDGNSRRGRNGTLVNLYNKVKKQLDKDIESNFYDGLKEEVVSDIMSIYDNWNLFIDYHSTYNIYVASNYENSLDEVEEEGGKDYFDKRGNAYNEFELVSNNVKTLFKFLPRAEWVIDLNGEYKVEESLDPETGLPMSSDYENLFKLTLDALKGIKDEPKFLEKLTSPELIRKLPELSYLFNILPVEDGVTHLSRKQRLLLNSFYQVFSRDFISVNASTREEATEKDELAIHYRYPSAKGNTNKILQQFTSNFSTNPEETEYIKVDDFEDEKNPDNSGYGNRRLYSLPLKKTLNDGKPIQLSDEDISSITISKIQSTYKNHFDFLKILGVEFSDLSLLTSTKDKISLIKILNSTLTIHDNITGRIERGKKLYNPLVDITGKRIQYIVTNEKTNKKETVTVPSLRSVVKDIIRFEGIFSKISPTVMSRGANGEKRSNITYSNALSIAAGQISNSNSLEELYEKSYFRKLRYNPLHLNSFVSKNIIGTRNKYSIEDYSGHVIEREEDSINSDTKSLSDVEKFKSDIDNLLGWGIINTPQLEQKSGYFALKYLDSNDQGIIPFDKENFINGFIMNNSQFFKQIVSYLKGEIQRVKDYDRIKNSLYTVPEAYGQLHIFNGMVSDKDMTYLLENNDWDENDKVIQRIKPKIEKFFQNQYDELNNFIVKNKLVDFISGNTITKHYGKEGLELYKESPEEIKELLLRTFIANDFIHNVEFGIFISGDPLFYKDWHKRLGGLASTGIQPSNTENMRLFFQDDKEVLFWDKYSLRGIMNQYSKDKVLRRDNLSTYLSAVLHDDYSDDTTQYHSPKMVMDYIHSVEKNTGKKITPKQAIEELQIDGLRIQISNGQGYLNLDAHRELSIKQDTYREQHDVSYKYEALIFKKYILEKDLTEDEEEYFSELERQIIRDPKKYALPILKQAYFGTLANEEVELDAKVFDKFSLAPLLPSMAKGHPKLKKLLKAMANRQIHYVKFESGTKAYVRDRFSVDDLLNEKTRLDILQSELLKLQILPSKQEKIESKIPTQMVKLLYTNLFDKGSSPTHIKVLRDNFIKSLNEIQKANKDYVLRKLGFSVNKNGKIDSWDKSFIIERIISQINLQKLPSTLLKALELDEKGEFINSIEASGIYAQLLNYITGKIDSTLREFKITGGDFVLISESMFDRPLAYFKLNEDNSIIEPLECRITLTEEFSKLLNLQDPKTDLKVVKKKIGTIDRLNELLKDKKFRKKYEKELTITFSRPPVQGPNSMGVGTVVEFFSPTAGNILQLPKEFMHQSGIDFDYDKEKVLAPSLSDEGFYLNDENIQKKLQDLNTQYRELRGIFNYVDDYTEEADWEDYEELMKSLLTNDSFSKLIGKLYGIDDLNKIPLELEEIIEISKNYASLRAKSIKIKSNILLENIKNSLQIPELFSELVLPNSFKTVRNLSMDNGKETNNFNNLPIGNSVYTYYENLKVFKMFNDARALLGPFALQNVFQQLIAPLDISINMDYARDAMGKPTKQINNLLSDNKDRVINITSREDDNGQNKQHLNSEFINATVDSAKDPYFANFMLSFDNISVFMFLFNLNYPVQTIIDFTSSAIVRKYLELKERNPNLRSEELYILTLAEANIIAEKKISLAKILSNDADNIGKSNKKLKKNLKKLKNDNSFSKEVYNQDHVDLLTNFIAMEQHSKQLSNFKNLFKNDTNKVTSLFEIYSRKELRNIVIEKGMFSLEDIKKVEDNSTMTSFRNDDLIENVIEKVFPLLSTEDVVNTLGNIFTERKSSLSNNESRVLSQVLTNDFIGSILFTFGMYKGENIYEYAKDLIRKRKIGNSKKYNETLLERIYKFKKNNEYEDLLSRFSVLDKMLGNVSDKAIKGNPIYNGKKGYNIELNIDTNVPLIQKENYMNQFNEILLGNFTTRDPLVKEALINFTKDFFIAGLLQSGLNTGGISFLEFIPIKFLQDLLNPTLENYKSIKENDPENYTNFLLAFDVFFKNNNSKFFYRKDTPQPIKMSHLGKRLRVMNFLFVEESENNNNEKEYTPEDITTLKPNEVFVFGSNTQGRHGLGAALIAKQKFGAKQGQAEGLQGQSYAIITKDLTKPKKDQLRSISLEKIADDIDRLADFAKKNPNLKFFVSKIGTNNAGYSVEEIKSVFKNSLDIIPDNVILPKEFEVRGSKTPTKKVVVESLPKEDEPLSELDKLLNQFTAHSGGAFGSDYDGWDTIGRGYGFKNFNHYWALTKAEKEKGKKPPKYGNVEIKETEAIYKEGKIEAAKAAAVTYGYEYPAMKDSLLIRNWAQVKNADAVFAIGYIVGVGKKLFPNIPNDTRLSKVIAVTGGTGYAVQMAINHKKPVYVFDQRVKVWAKYIDGVWSETDTPTLTKNYAAIGTRELNEDGKKAIKAVYEKTLASLYKNTLTKEELDNLKNLGFKPGKCE